MLANPFPCSGMSRFRPRLQWRGPRRLSTGFPLSNGAHPNFRDRAVTAPSILSKSPPHAGESYEECGLQSIATYGCGVLSEFGDTVAGVAGAGAGAG